MTSKKTNERKILSNMFLMKKRIQNSRKKKWWYFDAIQRRFYINFEQFE